MKNSYIILTLLLFFIAIIPAFAQGAPPTTPIDGGLSVLLAAGGIYAAKKIRDHRKEK